MSRLLIVGTIAVALAGCSNKSGFDPVSSVDRYSNARTVYIKPHGADCKSMKCVMLGASWIESDKDMVLLTISLANTTDFIRSASLEIDGKTYNLKDGGDLTRYNWITSGSSYYAKSSKEFLVPLGILKDITKAKKAWVFVQSGSGPVNNAIVDSQGDSKAFYAIERFVSSIPN